MYPGVSGSVGSPYADSMLFTTVRFVADAASVCVGRKGSRKSGSSLRRDMRGGGCVVRCSVWDVVLGGGVHISGMNAFCARIVAGGWWWLV